MVDTTFTGDDLFKAYHEFGELEGYLMDFVIRQWKLDDVYNHVFGSTTCVLLSPYFLQVSIYTSCNVFLSLNFSIYNVELLTYLYLN